MVYRVFTQFEAKTVRDMQFRESKFKCLQIEVNQSEVSICFVDMEYQI